MRAGNEYEYDESIQNSGIGFRRNAAGCAEPHHAGERPRGTHGAAGGRADRAGTGRNVREVRRFSEQLEAAPDWLVTANGAAVQHPDDREPAFFDGLSTEMVDVILKRVHCH